MYTFDSWKLNQRKKKKHTGKQNVGSAGPTAVTEFVWKYMRCL